MKVLKLIPLAALLPLSGQLVSAFSANNEAFDWADFQKKQKLEGQFQYKIEIPGRYFVQDLENIGVFELKGPYFTQNQNSYFAVSLDPARHFHNLPNSKLFTQGFVNKYQKFFASKDFHKNSSQINPLSYIGALKKKDFSKKPLGIETSSQGDEKVIYFNFPAGNPTISFDETIIDESTQEKVLQNPNTPVTLVLEGKGTLNLQGLNLYPIDSFLSDSLGEPTLQIFSEKNIGGDNARVFLDGGVLKVLSDTHLVQDVSVSSSSKLDVAKNKSCEISKIVVTSEKSSVGLENLGEGKLVIHEVEVQEGLEFALNAKVSGKQLLKKSGVGQLILQENQHTGGTVVEKGSVKALSSQSLGSGTCSLASETELTINPNLHLKNSFSINGDVSFNVEKEFSSLLGDISGSGLFIKKGPGILGLNAKNDAAYNVLIQEGVLAVNNQKNLPSGSIEIQNAILGILEPSIIHQNIDIKNDAKILAEQKCEIVGSIHGFDKGQLSLQGEGSFSISNVLVNDEESFTLQGRLTQSQPIIKKGKGSLHLEVQNKTAQPLIIESGAVFVQSNENIGQGKVTLVDGTIHLQNSISLPNPIEITGKASIISDADLDLDGSIVGKNGAFLELKGKGEKRLSTIDVPKEEVFVVKGPIVGKGKLDKIGKGNLTLDCENQSQVPVNIYEGVLEISSAKALGSDSLNLKGGCLKVSAPTAITLPIFIDKNSSIQAFEKVAFTDKLYAADSVSLTLQGPVEISNVHVPEGKDFSLEGSFLSSHDFVKTGDGLLFLKGDNVVEKELIIEKGTLAIADAKSLSKAFVHLKDSSLHTKSGVVLDNDFSIEGKSTWLSDDLTVLKGVLYGKDLQTLTLKGNGSIAIENIHVEENEKFSVFGDFKSENFVKTGKGLLSFETFTSISGNIEIEQGQILIKNDQSFGFGKVIVHEDANIEFVKETKLQNDFEFLGSQVIDTEHNISFSGRILKSKDIIKKGQNILHLLGDNTINGKVIVQEGVLTIANATNLRSSEVVLDGGKLEVLESTCLGQKFKILQDGAIFSNKTVEFSNLVEGSDQKSLSLEGKGQKVFSKISVPQGASFALKGEFSSKEVLEKLGGGTLVLNSANLLPLGVEIKEGNVQIRHAEALGKKGITVADNSVLEVGPQLTIDLPVQAKGDLHLSVAEGSSSLKQSVSGKEKNFIKIGEGELVLEANNEGFAKTILKEGSLKVSSVKSLGSDFLVFDGGELAVSKDLVIAKAEIASAGNLNIPDKTLVKFLNVEGNGTITKKGKGNVMIPITSAFDGAVVIEEGALLYTSAGPKNVTSLAGSGGLIRIDAAQELVITGNETTSFDGRVIGSGRLTIDGNTDLCLSGIVHPSVVVNQGCVHANGFCNVVQVGEAGIVKGTGLIRTLQVDGGVLAPGNSIGTITVDNLTFSPQSIFQVEISPTANSLAVVNLLADLSFATLEVIPQEGSYTVGQQWKILTAGSLSGSTFNKEIKTLDRYNFDLSYTDRDVYLTFLGMTEPVLTLLTEPVYQAPEVVNNSISLNGLSGNRQHVANYLNSQSNDLLGSSFDLLSQMTGDDLNHALDTISPARNSFATFTIQNVGFSLGSMVSSRLFDQRSLKDPLFTPVTIGKNKSSQALICSNDGKYSSAFVEVDSSAKVKGGIHNQTSENAFNIWGMGLGDFAKQMDQHQTPAFDLDSSLAVLGGDWGNLNQGILGACVAYGHSKIHDSRSFGHGQINSVYGAVYGLAYVGNFFFNAQLWGGYQHIDNLRKIFFSSVSAQAKSEHASASFNPHLGGGYDFYLGSKKQFTLEPFMDFDWVNVFENGYEEKGNSSYNMKFASRYSSMLQMESGLNSYWNGQFETGNLIVKGALSYILKAPFGTGSINSTLVGGVGSLKVEAFTEVQNIASPSVEVFWQDENGAFASIGYKGEFSYVYISNQVLGKLGYNF